MIDEQWPSVKEKMNEVYISGSCLNKYEQMLFKLLWFHYLNTPVMYKHVRKYV